MITACAPAGTVVLNRRDRDYIAWPVSGLSEVATVDASLENGPWLSLAITDDQVIGFFAGPDFVSPSPANVVASTSHVVIRVVDGQRSLTFDGGFIALAP